MTTLPLRSLNRATLARQLLLSRCDLGAFDVVEHLVGLQAQDPDPPYFGLWSRIEGFKVDDLTSLLYDRSIVRATLWRGTQHLVTAEDYLWSRPLVQPMLQRLQKSAFGRTTNTLDLDELVATAERIIRTQTPTRPELGRALAERWPGRDPVELARSVQFLLPVVHPPPDGTWGRRGTTPFTIVDQWLGRPLADHSPVDRLVLRYLAAFGPATVKDVQAWSGLTRLREVVDGLRQQLRVFHNEEGRELFDLPDAPQPGPDAEAPVRFLASLDNVVLAHHDRTRIVTDEQRKHTFLEPAVIVDGFVKALWNVKHTKETATLGIKFFEPLTPRDEEAVIAEGERLLEFAAPGAGHDIRLQPVAAAKH